MANRLFINKSGQTLTVRTTTSDTSAIVGYIYDREAYVYDSDAGGDGAFNHVKFLDASGNFKWGYLNFPPDGWSTSCISWPYKYNVLISGTKYSTFTLRKACDVYYPSGKYWKTIPAGRQVATNNDTMGQNYPYLKSIDYYQGDSGWERVCGNYGFVDTGIRSGSRYNKIAFYGGW